MGEGELKHLEIDWKFLMQNLCVNMCSLCDIWVEIIGFLFGIGLSKNCNSGK